MKEVKLYINQIKISRRTLREQDTQMHFPFFSIACFVENSVILQKIPQIQDDGVQHMFAERVNHLEAEA